MSANVSRQCQIELLRKQWAERLRAFLERGWRIDLSRGEIVAIDTVLASYQRGQTLLLWCRRADCRRRFEVDPSNLPEARQQGGVCSLTAVGQSLAGILTDLHLDDGLKCPRFLQPHDPRHTPISGPLFALRD